MALVSRDIEAAARLLRAGECVAIPTETVYGLAANANMPEAVARVYEIKERPRFNPLILHIAAIDRMETHAANIPDVIREMAAAFWPGPISFLLNRKDSVDPLITAGSNQVVLRMPDQPLTLELLSMLDFPLVAPSANRYMSVSPSKPEHVQEQIGERIPLILDGGACRVGLESTIVGFDGERLVVYRKGGLAMEELAGFGPEVVLAGNKGGPVTPGSASRHYAPRIPLLLGNLPELMEQHAGRKIAVLSFRHSHHPEREKVLSAEGKLTTAAAGLFSALYELQHSGAELILSERFPDEGLGRAINDRLERASEQAEHFGG